MARAAFDFTRLADCKFGREQEKFAFGLLSQIPDSLRDDAYANWKGACEINTRNGNLWLRGVIDKINKNKIRALGHIDIDARDEEFQQFAKDAAEFSLSSEALMYDRINPNAEAIIRIEQKYGIQIPGRSSKAKLARARDPRFWKKRVRKYLRQHREFCHLQLAPQKVKWVSVDGLREYKTMVMNHEKWATERALTNDRGECFQMPSPSDITKYRYAELITKSKGISTLANELLYKAMFVTVTLDTQFHASKFHGKKKRVRNEKYEDLSPREGQAFLTRQWTRCRAMLKDRGIEFKFIRGVHAHANSAPHWHFVLWVPDGMMEAAKAVIEFQFRTNENPAQIEYEIPRTEGGSIAYVSKIIGYMTRNAKDGDEKDAEEAMAVSAWASTHGIRRFSTSNSRSVAWRLARNDDVKCAPELKMAAKGTDGEKADYAKFVKLCESMDVTIKYDRVMNGYGETYKKPVGLNWNDKTGTRSAVKTKVWTIETIKKELVSNDISTVNLKSQETPKRSGFWSAAKTKLHELTNFIRHDDDDDPVFGGDQDQKQPPDDRREPSQSQNLSSEG